MLRQLNLFRKWDKFRSDINKIQSREKKRTNSIPGIFATIQFTDIVFLLSTQNFEKLIHMHVQNVRFIVSLVTADSSHRKSTSTGTSHDSCWAPRR